MTNTNKLEQAHRDFNDLNREALITGYERRKLAYAIADAFAGGDTPSKTDLSNYQFWTQKYTALRTQLAATEAYRNQLIEERNAQQQTGE
jgi:hypothetical protein